MLTGKFSIRKDNRILKFTNFDDIPSSFNHVVSFEPDYPEPPHTEEQHEEIEEWHNKFKELMKRETR